MEIDFSIYSFFFLRIFSQDTKFYVPSFLSKIMTRYVAMVTVSHPCDVGMFYYYSQGV